MRTYKERIDFIATCLAQLNIPFTMRPIWEGWQILCPWANNADVAVHDGTYGVKQGMVETYEFPWDEGDVTCLTPEEAADRIIVYWYQLNGWEV